MLYDAICISDLHLGARNCEAKRLRKFLHRLKSGKKIATRMLLIVGDGFDNLKTKKLKKRHHRVLRLIGKLAKRIKVVWIQGNHDPDPAYVRSFVDVQTGEDYTFQSGGKSVYVSHGHQYDHFIENHPKITMAADMVYGLTQFIDPTYTLARYLKKKSKKFIKVMRKIKLGVSEKAASLGCEVAIHGHNHHAGHLHLNGVDVWDAGCWTERPCSYLTVNNGVVELHHVGR